MTAEVKATTKTPYVPQENYDAYHILSLPEEILSLIEHAIITDRPTNQPLSFDKVALPIKMTSAEIRAFAQTVSRFSRTNKLFHEQCKPLMENLRKKYDDRLNHETHQSIIDTTHIAYERENEENRELRAQKLQAMIDAFGGMEKFYKYGILDLGNNTGDTDYIDFVTHDAFIGQPFPIMVGRDRLNRPFFSVILLHRNPLDLNHYTRPLFKEAVNIQNQVGFVATFFQRYSNGTSWTCGNNTAIGVHLLNLIDPLLMKDIVEGNHPDFILGNIEAYNTWRANQPS